MAVTLQTVLEDLNYILGDTSVPSSGIDNQKRFINLTNEKIYDYHDWRWATNSTSYVFSGSTQTLPTDFNNLVEVREEITGADNDNIYDIVNETDIDRSTSEYIAYVSGNEEDGFTLSVNQTDNPTLKTTLKIKASDMSATTDETKCPRSMPIARGAVVLMQEAEDPYRDTTQALRKYQDELDDLIRLDVRTKPSNKFFTKSMRRGGRAIGEPR